MLIISILKIFNFNIQENKSSFFTKNLSQPLKTDKFITKKWIRIGKKRSLRL